MIFCFNLVINKEKSIEFSTRYTIGIKVLHTLGSILNLKNLNIVLALVLISMQKSS